MTSQCLTSPNATPFTVTVQDAILLDRSEGFSILREHLADYSCNEFCEDHYSESLEDLQSWVVMRDVLHALLAPVVALTSHATGIAQRYTKSERASAIEFAFRGRGRNAFVWLQSFLADDEDWCLSKACPGCVVQYAIDAEFQIRMMVAACMLSTAQGPGPHNGPTLPSFDFFLPSLRNALAEDELWGPDYYASVETKAQDLNFGMQDLMRQCERLEKIMTPPTTPAIDEEEEVLPSFSYFSDRRGSLKTSSKTFYPKTEQPSMRIKRSNFTKVQAKMAKEEEAWIQNMVQNAWQTINFTSFEFPSMPALRRISVTGAQ